MNRRYEEWYESFDICPKMVIDGDKYDFVEDPSAGEEIVRLINQHTKKIEERALEMPARYTTDREKVRGIFHKKNMRCQSLNKGLTSHIFIFLL